MNKTNKIVDYALGTLYVDLLKAFIKILLKLYNK